MQTRPHPFTDRARFWIAVPLALLCGILIGVLLPKESGGLPYVTTPDTRKPEATVHLQGIRNGELLGETKGDVRVVAGDRPVTILEDGTFAIDDRDVLTNIVEIEVPAGMNFVASSRGKYFYAIDSAAGARIAPANRQYFKDRASAEAAGFLMAE